MGFGPEYQTYQVGANFKALGEGVLVTPLDSRYTQVGFNLISVQVCFPPLFQAHKSPNRNTLSHKTPILQLILYCTNEGPYRV